MAKGKTYRNPIRKSSSSTIVFSMLLMVSFVVLILLSLGIVSLPSSNPGKSHTAHDLASIAHNSLDRIGRGEDRGDQWVEVISWEPRAFVYHNFLSKEECEYLIELAKPHMHKSTVVDSKTGKSKDSRVRTSSGTFLARGRDKTIRNIEKRIADFSFIPIEHGEGLQILHYEVGQEYEPHYDYFLDEFNTKNGGQRIATVLMYLSDVEEGVRQYSLLPKETSVLYLTGMSYPNVIPQVCTVAAQLLKGISGHLRNGCDFDLELPVSITVSPKPWACFGPESDRQEPECGPRLGIRTGPKWMNRPAHGWLTTLSSSSATSSLPQHLSTPPPPLPAIDIDTVIVSANLNRGFSS
ncbi:hypothetical protein Dimus_014041 [Dionaea muscipula]